MASTEEFWAARRARDSEELGRLDQDEIFLDFCVFYFKLVLYFGTQGLLCLRNFCKKYFIVPGGFYCPPSLGGFYCPHPGGCFNGEVEVIAKVESREKAQILEILLSEQGGNSKNIELTKTEYFLNILKILLIKPKYFPAQVGEADLA